MDSTELKRRLAELRDEHRGLDERIRGMLEAGAFDQLEVQRLKKRKLVLKDQIILLESESLPDIIA
jgi:hypothetical protein